MLCRMLLSVFPIPERQQYEGLAQSRRRLGSNVQDVDSSVQQAKLTESNTRPIRVFANYDLMVSD
jgi:hypothetical protein